MELPDVSSMAKSLADELKLSDAEYTMVEDAMKSIYAPLPQSKSGASAMIDELLQHKSNIFYIKTAVNRSRGITYRNYRSQIDIKFTILTRQGRPSRDAIYSEIHSQSGDLRMKRDQLDKWDEYLDVLNTLILMIESKMKVVDNKRYDID